MELQTRLILALDLGKFKTMCCFFDTNTRKAEFQVAATERDYLAKVLTAVWKRLILTDDISTAPPFGKSHVVKINPVHTGRDCCRSNG